MWDTVDWDRAEGLNRICIRSALATGNEITLGLGLFQGAVFAARRGDAERSARLFGAGSSHFAMALAPFQHEVHGPAEDQARSVIGDDRFGELHRVGAAMGTAEAAAYALG